ncbi:MAG: bifunctional methylenetetrahydrofolate dehydrogenase/methenyltetrahydrofolate cyclohydrolase FolD [Oscillospiraceae bacterium]|nr:bifunctional methylenetetrahydrofolate dehydrogenase/methenyltetrahydrofolate cyclohydrolase FolD [Oscillospiraceae bacterium]
MAKILDGKALSAEIKQQIKTEIEQDNLKVGLAVVIVGADPASRVYVDNKKRDCTECGITSHEFALPEETTQQELIELIEKLNADENINGILVQQPFPKHINVTAVNETISPLKDVDAFRFESAGRIMAGKYSFLPCTPAGVMELLRAAEIEIAGKECVVIGRSDIVGKPMAMLLLHENATVTICHSRTKDLPSVTKRADILVSAVGIADFVSSDMVKENAVVVDVGMNRNSEGKLCGDVKYAEVSEKASYITPVPGGVGPMTRAVLMKNTLSAKKLQS